MPCFTHALFLPHGVSPALRLGDFTFPFRCEVEGTSYLPMAMKNPPMAPKPRLDLFWSARIHFLSPLQFDIACLCPMRSVYMGRCELLRVRMAFVSRSVTVSQTRPTSTHFLLAVLPPTFRSVTPLLPESQRRIRT